MKQEEQIRVIDSKGKQRFISKHLADNENYIKRNGLTVQHLSDSPLEVKPKNKPGRKPKQNG